VNYPLLIVLLILCAAMVAFIINKPRMDVVGFLVLISLPLLGIIDVKDALAGFSDSSVILIAVLFVIGDGLMRTGIAYRLGDWLVDKAGGSEWRLVACLMLAVATLGSIMSSTGVVAIFIPVVLGVTRRLNIHPARLMMPLSIAALISGMLTLVGTPPNLIADSALRRAGYTGLGFLDFTPIGLIILVVAVAYVLATRRWLAKKSDTSETQSPASQRHNMRDLVEKYGLAGREHRLRIRHDSPFAGKRLLDCTEFRQFDAEVVAIERPGRFVNELINPHGSTQLAAGDMLLVDIPRVLSETVAGTIFSELGLETLPLQGIYFTDQSRQIGMAEVILPPDSSLPGKSILDLGFRTHYRLTLIGLRRGGQALPDDLAKQTLRAGDTLLVIGPWKAIYELQAKIRDFVVLGLPREVEQVVPVPKAAPYALMALLVMVVLMVFSSKIPHMSNVMAALIGCTLMGLVGAVTMDSAYRSINWRVVILIVGMLPIATALQKTGGIDLAVNGLMGAFGNSDPRLFLAALFLVTTLIGLVISNTVTAVLMAPIAISAAQALQVSPYPLAIAVALAASTSFITPVSSPVNMLVYGPGQYRFMDFVKVGLPLSLLVMLICVWMIPLLFPF